MTTLSESTRIYPRGAGRVDWVDVAKGVSIVLVVAMHATLGLQAAVGQAGWMGAVVAFAEPFRMAAFFLLAGLFLARTIDEPWRRTLDRKVLHFVYFYVLWMSLQFAVKAPGWAAEHGAASTAFLWLRSFVEPFGTLWFIYVLPLFFLAARLMRDVPPPVRIGAAVLLAVAPVHTGWLVADAFADKFVYFLAGHLFARHVFRFAEAVRAAPPAALAGLAFWALANGAGVAYGLHRVPGLDVAAGFAGAGAVVAAAVFVSAMPFGRILRICGERSIAIYLAFFLPMALTRAALVQSGLVADVGTASLIVTLAAVAVPLAMVRITETTGAARFLFERPAWARLPDVPAAAPRPAPAE